MWSKQTLRKNIWRYSPYNIVSEQLDRLSLIVVEGEELNTEVSGELIIKINLKSDFSLVFKISTKSVNVKKEERKKQATKMFAWTVAAAIV